ncbi:MAG: hypothetical protein WCG05_05500 [Alphaproteobacteria bacterium]
MIKNEIESLSKCVDNLKNKWGGDITFFPPTFEETLKNFELVAAYKLPEIFHWFYLQKNNGLKIDNKGILGCYDKNIKKTYVENLERFNDPKKEIYFQGRPEIFNDYLIVGYDHLNLICLSKKYNFENPLLYICSNPNSKKGVDFYRTTLTLEGFLKKIATDTFDDDGDFDQAVLK